ncbi:MAG: hypothetical protein ABIT09_06450 [Croceibacterium sp.]
MRRAAALAAVLLMVAACNRAPDTVTADLTSTVGAGQPGPSSNPTPSPVVREDAAPTPAPVATPPSASTRSETPAPIATPLTAVDKGETGARDVLLTWARALELGDYDRAFAQWGTEAEARSGMTRTGHAAYWRKFKTITVAVPTGTMDGAMGSSYYQVPTTVVGKQRANGKPYRLAGTVTLRRVKDVDGATADQLRWHIEQVDLKPVT